ncbi:MAG: molybdenum cofactor guanylyltransferase [Phormidesmis sp.]
MTASVSVVILAGGYSCRMGKDKALLAYNGRSLLSRTVEVAQILSSDVVIVTPWPERYRHVVPAAVRFVQEPAPSYATATPLNASSSSPLGKPSSGPLSGFAEGWQQVSSDWCLLLACDLPYLDASILQAWWNWIVACSKRGWPGAADFPDLPMASLVASERGWEPLCGYYHRRCLPQLEHQLSLKRQAFQPWLATLAVMPYSLVPPQMLFNCNTPADWAMVQSGGLQSGDSLENE